MIEIFLDLENSKFDTISIAIDSKHCDYTIEDNKIVIDTLVDPGVHMLDLQMLGNSQRITIKDVKVLGSSLREFIYLSYIQMPSGERLQPQTALWDTTQVWKLPFANPMSFWLTLVNSKLKAGDLGTDLYKKYYIEYPDSIMLPDDYPQLIKDFYRYNFDFVCVEKSNLFLRPYIEHQGIAKDFVHEILEYIEQNKKFLIDNSTGGGQAYYNNIEFGKSEWQTVRVFYNSTEKIKLPWIDRLKKELGITAIRSMTIGFLPPGGFLAPHIDSVDKTKEYLGCCVFYLPLTWPKGSTFKFNGAPTVFENASMVINNAQYVHALTNSGDQERIVITVTPEA